MDEQRRLIATALHQYRETVFQHNFSLLHVLVECIAASPSPLSHSLRKSAEMQKLHQDLQSAIPEPVDPKDLPSNDIGAELIRQWELDGVASQTVNIKLREEYFAGIQRQISEMNGKVEEFPPADLEYLCTLVSGVTGPGLPYRREHRSFSRAC